MVSAQTRSAFVAREGGHRFSRGKCEAFVRDHAQSRRWRL